MIELKVYEKAEELGVLILGLATDSNRKRFNDMVSVLEEHDVKVMRYNDVDNRDQIDATMKLPRLVKDGKVLCEGRYPQVFEMAEWFGIDKDSFSNVTRTGILDEANTAYGGPCCGINADVYLDPNEDDES